MINCSNNIHKRCIKLLATIIISLISIIISIITYRLLISSWSDNSSEQGYCSLESFCWPLIFHYCLIKSFCGQHFPPLSGPPCIWCIIDAQLLASGNGSIPTLANKITRNNVIMKFRFPVNKPVIFFPSNLARIMRGTLEPLFSYVHWVGQAQFSLIAFSILSIEEGKMIFDY